jgi:hypothetical protein
MARKDANQATMVFPDPTSPCNSRCNRLGLRHIGFDLGQRAALCAGKLERATGRACAD